MFGSIKNGASAYAKVGVETGVLAASPHRLIVMLFEGAETALRAALAQMSARDIPGKGRSISKAINIIDNGLRASLDTKAGGEIAGNLEALYEYMNTRLLQANLNNSEEMVQEVLKLLGELKGAWESIAPSPAAANPGAPAARLAGQSYDALAPRAGAFVSA
ncbi:MAG: flagellar export chaperone FliS [Pseudomonadota bacterium]